MNRIDYSILLLFLFILDLEIIKASERLYTKSVQLNLTFYFKLF